jgi:replicative DNA helicase Mcm
VSGNPEGSRFDSEVPLPEQVDIDQSLLTRFDAIVLLTDTVDEEQDRKIASHITESWRESVDMVKDKDVEPDATQRQVSAEVAQAWVAAGREIIPELTDEAAERLTDFYVEVRGFNSDQDTISATARQLEGGIRFAMAFARMRLSETVETQDVDMAIDVSRALIGQTHDGEGNFNIDRLTVETKDHAPKTQSRKREAIRETLKEGQSKTPAQIAEETGIDKQTVEKELESMMQKNPAPVMKPQEGVYRGV